jgi:hypothetical protein
MKMPDRIDDASTNAIVVAADVKKKGGLSEMDEQLAVNDIKH